LYNGSLNTLPEQQGALLFASSGGSVATEAASSGKTTLDSGDAAVKAGWSTLLSNLDRTTGFDLSFDLKINSETHNTNDRAGTSVILLGSDHQGVELGFWTNDIWAQTSSPAFTHGEEHAFDTTAMTHYDLSIQGSSYNLSANGTSILTGPVRDYGGLGASPNVYAFGNFVFIGDDTTSATGSMDFASMAIAPEPGTLFALVPLLFIRKRR
jgi:hypothetical protein